VEKKEHIKTSWGIQNLVHKTNHDYKRRKNLAYIEHISTKEGTNIWQRSKAILYEEQKVSPGNKILTRKPKQKFIIRKTNHDYQWNNS
jgi:hypothetical protein